MPDEIGSSDVPWATSDHVGAGQNDNCDEFPVKTAPGARKYGHSRRPTRNNRARPKG